MLFVILQNTQYITACRQFLMNGGDKPWQLALNQLHPGLDQLVGAAALLEIGQKGQHNNKRSQYRKDEQARNHAQQNQAGLQDSVCRVDFGSHVQPSRCQLAFQPSVFVLIHVDKGGQLQRPSEDEGFQRFDQTPVTPSRGDEGAFRRQPRDLQKVGKDKIQSGSQCGAEQK